MGVNLIDESILQVISKFSPFDDEQRVDILTNCSNVYTIRYHKYVNIQIVYDSLKVLILQKNTLYKEKIVVLLHM